MTQPNANNPNVLELSDEDFMKTPAPVVESQPASDPEPPPTADPAPAPEPEPAPADPEPTPADPDPSGSDPEPPPADDPSLAAADDKPVPGDPNAPAPKDPAEPPAAADPAKPAVPADKPAADPAAPAAPAPINYEAEYKKIMAPFKANGSLMQARTPEEVLQLMQMGANYHAKMAGLKPVLKSARLLQQNDLVDPEKLAFAIDLVNGKPEAIQKLLKDKGINPLDIDTKEEPTYKAQPKEVNEKELELDEVLNEIQGSPSYNRTLTVVADEWDEHSRSVVAQNPQIIKLINAHIDDGTYDRVMAEVKREVSFGRLKGVPTLEAYRLVGDWMDQNGLLAKPAANPQASSATPADTPPAKPGTNPAPQPAAAPQPDKAASEKDRQARREKLAPTRIAPAPGRTQAINPLDVPDDQFSKMSEQNFRIQG